MHLYLGGLKQITLSVNAHNIYLGRCNQMFMNSRMVSPNDKILSKKSSEMGELITKIGKVI